MKLVYMNDICVLISSHITCVERIGSLVKCINSLMKQTVNIDILLSISFENNDLMRQYLLLREGICNTENHVLKITMNDYKMSQFEHLMTIYDKNIYYDFTENDNCFSDEDGIVLDQEIQYKYVMFCDDDDYYQPNRVEKFSENFKSGFQCVCETVHFDEYDASVNYHEYVYYGVQVQVFITFIMFMKGKYANILKHKFCDLLLSRFIQNKILCGELHCVYIFEAMYIQNRHFHNSVTSCILDKNKGTGKEKHTNFDTFITRLNEDLNDNIVSLKNNVYPMVLIKELSFQNMLKEQFRRNFKYYTRIDRRIIRELTNEYQMVSTLVQHLNETSIEVI